LLSNLLMFKSQLLWAIRFAQVWLVIFTFAVLTGCLPDRTKTINPEDFFQSLENQGVSVSQLSPDQFSNFQNIAPGYAPLGIYQTDEDVWALYDLPVGKAGHTDLFSVSNLNLTIFSENEIPVKVSDALVGLSSRIGYEQLGIFAYPLGACLLIAVFITLERLFSLRRGVTFPRKVEKALLRGEFPNKKWKRGSAAERIVHVAVHEKASEDTIRAYARLEISAMERGMFLLEVIVAGAPLIGLLGTVTGLVEVFSNMPAGGTVDKTLFSEGISLALLTTMAGLAIALPTLLFNSYLQRVLDKRSVSLDWLTSRLIDAVDRKGTPAEVIR
jgi:biopolymer transport protein ExbB